VRIHKCDGPEADETGWAPDKVDKCPHHGHSSRPQYTHRNVTGRQKRATDRAAGVQGIDRGSYISGRDSGR
jgi:hypothetical protein